MVKQTSVPARRIPSRLVTQDWIDKRIASGVGQGVREQYRPWIKVRSVASLGSSHIVPGVRIRRAHHLLSKAEFHFHLILEHDPAVIDIREQFPLLPQAETYSIACSLGYRPVFYPRTKVPHVFTTDFVITSAAEGGGEKVVARTLKYRKEITELSPKKRARLLEKLAIEKLYWSRRGVDWKLVLYEHLSPVHIQNLVKLRSHALVSASLATEKNFQKVSEFIDASRPNEISLRLLITKLSKALFMDYKEVKSLFFHMLWQRRLSMDFENQEIDLAKPLNVSTQQSLVINICVERRDHA
ncbi:endonuclease|uniref:TnsA endonuclease N-terminal domain-containing protein n=1 Tax=Pseudomonas sp. SbOxS1 TaxID=2723884 RepID=UPI0015D3C5CF|nr:TnsA endonuclease N-terminal domain-containing protein [Pseudomonas sp. SbOxS1]NYU01372.1 endonuclease [Pseudomonas sp. SbOxS1]